jgi:hypothetical protein
MALLLSYSDPAAADNPHHARFATITPGAPGRCPACDAFGYMDHLDPLGRFQRQHCRSCRCTWEYRFDDTGRISEVHGPQSFATIDLDDEGGSGVIDLRNPAPSLSARDVANRSVTLG